MNNAHDLFDVVTMIATLAGKSDRLADKEYWLGADPVLAKMYWKEIQKRRPALCATALARIYNDSYSKKNKVA